MNVFCVLPVTLERTMIPILHSPGCHIKTTNKVENVGTIQIQQQMQLFASFAP